MIRTVLARGALGVGALAAGGGYYAFKSHEGFNRSSKFWVEAFPIYLHYRYTEWWNKHEPTHVQTAQFNTLHDAYAPVAYDLVLRLRGFFLKLAQVVSVRDDILPPQYATFLKTLQDQVPPEYNEEQVREMVSKALGRPLREVFLSFDNTPLGAASIGQAHRATLLDGREVVVKLQFPRAEKLFGTDIDTILDFCRLAMPHNVPALLELKKQFASEFDYKVEAENMRVIADNINNSQWSKQVVVPKPISELCTKDVLVMEYLPGVKMTDGVKKQFSRIAAKQGKTLEQLEEEQKEKIRRGEIGTGPSKFQMKAYIAILQLRDLAYNIPKYFVNWFFRTPLRLPHIPYEKTEQPINIPEILDILLKVHGHEIFVDGVFNADPHPGNVLLMPDGRLGLIDYGQMKHLQLSDRRKYARLIIALADDNKEEVVRIFRDEMGMKTKNMNPDVMFKLARFWNDTDNLKLRDGLNVQLYLESLESADPVVEAPGEYVLASRVSVLLRGVGSAFQQELSTAKAWRPYAEKLLASTANES